MPSFDDDLDDFTDEDNYYPPPSSSEEEEDFEEFPTSEEDANEEDSEQDMDIVEEIQESVFINRQPAQMQVQDASFHCAHEGCQKSFATKRRLSRHILTHSGKRPFSCPNEECGKTFIRREHLTRHLVVHETTVEAKRPYVCQVEGCLSRYAYKTHLKRHMMTHEIKKPWKCQDCDACFAKHDQLRRHLSVHTGKLPYACGECEKSFPTPSKLKAHARTHSNQLSYHCGQVDCGLSFSKWSELQKHIKANHTNLTCQICQRTFKRKDILTSHLKTHDPLHVPSVQCSFDGCEKVFMTEKSLGVHVKSFHLQIKPFECDWPECKSRFSNKPLLARHLKTHLNPKPRKKRKDAFHPPDLVESISGNYKTETELNYPCGLCSVRFRRQYDLDRHQTSH
jgi:general transcription factor IIIA